MNNKINFAKKYPRNHDFENALKSFLDEFEIISSYALVLSGKNEDGETVIQHSFGGKGPTLIGLLEMVKHELMKKNDTQFDVDECEPFS